MERNISVGRELLGKFFYDLAKIMCAALVAGGIIIIMSDYRNPANYVSVSVGMILTTVFALIGYVVTNKKE